jgi:hypothetical protein
MKSTRQEVYRAIDGERNYQEYRWHRPEHIHSVTEYLVYIEYYVNRAKVAVSSQDDEQGALDDLRKITALGVAAMEENGAVQRVGWESV